MIDRTGRAIDYLRLSLTPSCDLRCTYCLPELPCTSWGVSLQEEDFRFVISVAAALGVRRLRLTGGEPLLVPFVTDLVRFADGVEGLVDISLTTNGLALPLMAQGLKDAGLDRVNISLDSLRPQRYREITRGGNLERAWSGVMAALQSGLSPVKLNVVIIGGFNDDEVSDFAELTRQLPLAVRFIELMPFGECVDWPSSRFVPVAQIRGRLGTLVEAEEIGGGPASVWRIPGAMGTVGFISGVSQHFCSSCNRMRVTSEGALRPCLFADSEVNLLPAIRARDYVMAASLIMTGLGQKPDRMAMQKLKRMAEIGG